jgi:non-canonical purine NTP pyrophosphatase (RdgB/HAM1 family)
MLKEIHFATGNPGKLEELQDILPLPVHQIDLDLPEVQALAVADVVEAKAREAYRQTDGPVLIEDTGLHFEAWDGLPGALIKWFLKTVGNAGLCQMMEGWENRAATAITILGFFDGNAFHSFAGEIKGRIVETPRGDGGFGWDPVFEPQGWHKTFAEMSVEEKNAISMRRRAADKLCEHLLLKNRSTD